MTPRQFAHGFRLEPVAKGSPEALVVLLHDLRATASTLVPVAERWAKTVPTTAFIALDGVQQFDPLVYGLPAHTTRDIDRAIESTTLDRVALTLDPLIEQELRAYRLNAARLVLVGFGYGGTLALHMLLRQGWSCSGVLAFGAKLMLPLPPNLRLDRKVRLIDGSPHIGHDRLRNVVAMLTARGIDTRGVLLIGSLLSDEAIRHGGSYLVELVATAQRSDRRNFDWESSHAQ